MQFSDNEIIALLFGTSLSEPGGMYVLLQLLPAVNQKRSATNSGDGKTLRKRQHHTSLETRALRRRFNWIPPTPGRSSKTRSFQRSKPRKTTTNRASLFNWKEGCPITSHSIFPIWGRTAPAYSFKGRTLQRVPSAESSSIPSKGSWPLPAPRSCYRRSCSSCKG